MYIAKYPCTIFLIITSNYIPCKAIDVTTHSRTTPTQTIHIDGTRGYRWRKSDFGYGRGWVSSENKRSPKPILTKIYVPILRCRGAY